MGILVVSGEPLSQVGDLGVEPPNLFSADACC